MNESSMKTSWRQRLVIIVIAVLLLGSTVATYIFIVLNGNNSSTATNEEQITQLSEQYEAKNAELEEASKPLSDKYFPIFSQYQSQVKAYNETAATNAVLKTEDLLAGTGKQLTDGDKDYLAYYVGWCADGTVFDSSFDNTGKESEQAATSLKSPLDPSNGLIEGWEQGIIGMKLGGVRVITMNGDLGYGDTREICGGYNKPLKFLVMPIESDANIVKLTKELSDLWMQLIMSYYGTSN